MHKRRGRQKLETAARRQLQLRARPAEVERVSKFIKASGLTQTIILRTALTEYLDRYAPEISA